MSYAQTKQQAHELIERMAPGQIFAVVAVMETMLDPVSRAIANAPIDDEPETDAERQAVAASKAWMAEHQQMYREGKVGDVAIKRKLIEILNGILEPIRVRGCRGFGDHSQASRTRLAGSYQTPSP